MKAQVLVLAAGRGERMRPLTDHTPKPLLKVSDNSLIEWTLKGLHSSGYAKVLINTAWLGEQIRHALGTSFTPSQAQGATPMQLAYSAEDVDFGSALETAGGIVRALPQLSDPFWVVAADIFCPSFRFDSSYLSALKASAFLGHLWLVDNPPHHPQGDFCTDSTGMATLSRSLSPFEPSHSLTFSTIGVYKHAFFETFASEIPFGNPHGIQAPLGPILKRAIKAQSVLASQLSGQWVDVGTPERLALLNPH